MLVAYTASALDVRDAMRLDRRLHPPEQLASHGAAFVQQSDMRIALAADAAVVRALNKPAFFETTPRTGAGRAFATRKAVVGTDMDSATPTGTAFVILLDEPAKQFALKFGEFGREHGWSP